MKLSRGKNWARWVYAVLVLLTIPTAFCPDVSAGVTFYDIAGYGILAVQLYVVLLLLHQESAQYFVPPAGVRAPGEAS